jgi:protein-tyrosine phosphatase
MQVIERGVHQGKLLAHCVGGMSRSPIMVGAWLHRCGYAEIHNALHEIAEMRDIDPSPVLLKSVEERLSK